MCPLSYLQRCLEYFCIFHFPHYYSITTVESNICTQFVRIATSFSTINPTSLLPHWPIKRECTLASNNILRYLPFKYILYSYLLITVIHLFYFNIVYNFFCILNIIENKYFIIFTLYLYSKILL
jgi:hypothetical protein